ncbi:hypothetical protein M3J09_007940 [Ascochyta lentis]
MLKTKFALCYTTPLRITSVSTRCQCVSSKQRNRYGFQIKGSSGSGSGS